jgi:spore coat polysaccharide biosynthesis protein SpsF
MGSPVVQIQARLGSTRLPGKVLYTIGSRRILEWVVERASSADKPTNIILTTGDRPENDAIREWCNRSGLTCDTGPEENLLERHLQAATLADSDPVVRITGDCPFIPSSEIDRVIREHEQNDGQYTTNHTDQMPIGTAVDVIDRSVLEELYKRGDSHPVRRLRENPGDWNVIFTSNNQWSAFADAHIAVDTPDDYWTLLDAIEAVGDEPTAVAQWITEQ